MKRKISILISVVLLAIISIFLISKPRKFKDLDDVMALGRLTVLIESGEYGFAKDSLQVYGFQYEIIKTFADSLGIELVIINQENVKDAPKMLTKGECDILVSLKPVIKDSFSTIVSAKPILSSRLVLAQNNEAKLIRKQYELDGDTLFTTKTSSFKDKLEYMFDDLAIDLTIIEIDDMHTSNLVELVNEQKIKFTFCPEYLVNRLAEEYPNVNFSLALSFPFDLAWTLNVESYQLLTKLNDFLDEYLKSSEFNQLKQKYKNK